jgi:DNA replication protein
MPPFKGFPDGKVRNTPLPEPFFSEVMPFVNHLGELKLILYAFWRLDRMEGAFRYLRRDDFAGDAIFLKGLGAKRQDAESNLDDALASAVKHGVLLEAKLHMEGGQDTMYFLNSPKGRAALKAIESGAWVFSSESHLPVILGQERPNIFELYEQNVGPLTPMIADTLREAEKTYSPHWIEDAFRIAVENNVRNWRYIAAILNRWQVEGRDE